MNGVPAPVLTPALDARFSSRATQIFMTSCSRRAF